MRTMAEARRVIGKRKQGDQWIVTDHDVNGPYLDESRPMSYGLACACVRTRREAWLKGAE